MITCKYCNGEFGDRHAMLAHALRSHPLGDPWQTHLRPLLTAAQRTIIGNLIEKEALDLLIPPTWRNQEE